MNEQEMQQQFMQWLAKKTGVKNEQELQQVLSKLQGDPERMQQAMQEFQNEASGGQPIMKDGGKLAYIECLKKGGDINCGCIKKGKDGTKATSQTNAGAIKSPKYPALGNKPVMFTKKEVDQMPGWETATTPMRTHAEGGILLAGRGARLAARADRISARSDRAAERSINRKDAKLVADYNYQGVEKSPGVFERSRNRFDEGAETLLKAQQPLDGGDARGRTQPSVITSRPLMEKEATTGRPTPKAEASTTPTKVNPANIKSGTRPVPQSPTNRPTVLPEVEVIGRRKTAPGTGIITTPAAGQPPSFTPGAGMTAEEKQVIFEGLKKKMQTPEWKAKASGRADITHSPLDYLAGPAAIEFLGTTALRALPSAIGMGSQVIRGAIGAGAPRAIGAVAPRLALGVGQKALGAGAISSLPQVATATGLATIPTGLATIPAGLPAIPALQAGLGGTAALVGGIGMKSKKKPSPKLPKLTK